jgi:glycerol uptake facilitator protein
MAAAATVRGKTGWRGTSWGEYLSEFLGTFVLIMFGDGVVAMAVAGLNQSGRAATPHTIFLAAGDWLLIGFGWFFAVCLAVYVAGGISGAHLNPAVTVALAAKRGFAWTKVPGYIVAQVLGAFVAAVVVYFVYQAAIDSYETVNHVTRGTPDSVATYSIFATFPAPYFHNVWGPLLDQIVGTALLVGVILAIVDELGTPVRANMAPYIVGVLVGAIGLSFGANAGYAINPARDFGPRVFAAIAGYDKIAFPGDYGNINSYFWIPIVGPFVGGLLGAYIYDFFIHNTYVALGKTPSPTLEEMGVTTEDLTGYIASRAGGTTPESHGRTVEEQ